ncbi:hypothetical protein ABQE45_17100 [Mycobacteroides chelonae]
MTDIENLLTQVWDPESRSLAEEAWRCYNAGATRASVVATWTAVIADVISKVGHLSDDSDPTAQAVTDEVSKAQELGLSIEGVRAMQRIEGMLLVKAMELEIIDGIQHRELERIKEDRNLCAHPSLKRFSEVYVPLPEVARAHLVTALDTLLIHRPTQGRKIIDTYLGFTCSAAFVPTVSHIQSAYFDRVRSATRRNIAKIAAKHALLELDLDGHFDEQEYADRSASVLAAFSLRDRDLVREVVTALRDRFRHASGDVQCRALARLGVYDFFWDMTDSPLVDQLNNLIKNLPINETRPLRPRTASLISLVANEVARHRLPELGRRFSSLPPEQRSIVMASKPDPSFVSPVIELLRSARTWRFGEQVGQLLVEHAGFLRHEDLRRALESWSANDQCWRASLMPEVAVQLFKDTDHLGSARVVLFEEFLSRVRAATDDDYYTYPALAEELGIEAVP